MELVEADRLLRLARFLRTVPEEMFDMTSFGQTEDVQSSKILVLSLENPVCGSAGCALGWATVVFPDQFLLKKIHSLSSLYGLHFRGDGVPRQVGYSSYQVCRFFGIDPNEASFLFAPIPRRAKEVADNIEGVARRRGWQMKENGTVEVAAEPRSKDVRSSD